VSDALPDSHQALLKCVHLLEGRVALLGIAEATLLASLPGYGGNGLAMTEHAGVRERLEAQPGGWEPLFGYLPEAEQAGSYQTVVIFLPKARAEVQLRLALARHLAASGGRILLIGGKKEGIARAGKQFREQLPGAMKVESVRHCQVWLAEQVTPFAEYSLDDFRSWHSVVHRDVELQVAGLPGIFSDGHLDDGTALLLDTLADTPIRSGRVLDFACGAGVIGSWLQAWRNQNDQQPDPVDGIDVQYQAIHCARETYAANGAEGNVLASDGLQVVQQRYRAILSNPPFHTGIHTDTSVTGQFLSQVARHLLPGGELRLVANSFLGYEALIRRHAGPVEVIASNRRFVVYRCIRK
jgi:16S rRNA (guanine1207-N2)-methyltransferase